MQRQLCDYAIQLTIDPGSVGATELDQLRDVGWTDEQLSIAVQVVGYFNYINRVADGLGVEPESWMSQSPESWLAAKGKFRS